MQAKLDHVVLWVADPLRSLEFYEKVLGLTPVRADEFRESKAPFPSMRVSSDSIIDLMPKVTAPPIDQSGTAGNLVNPSASRYRATTSKRCAKRLADNGVSVSTVMTNSFGARGLAPEAFYFRDPDNNVIEARLRVGPVRLSSA